MRFWFLWIGLGVLTASSLRADTEAYPLAPWTVSVGADGGLASARITQDDGSLGFDLEGQHAVSKRVALRGFVSRQGTAYYPDLSAYRLAAGLGVREYVSHGNARVHQFIEEHLAGYWISEPWPNGTLSGGAFGIGVQLGVVLRLSEHLEATLALQVDCVMPFGDWPSQNTYPDADRTNPYRIDSYLRWTLGWRL